MEVPRLHGRHRAHKLRGKAGVGDRELRRDAGVGQHVHGTGALLVRVRAVSPHSRDAHRPAQLAGAHFVAQVVDRIDAEVSEGAGKMPKPRGREER